jgi:hypothetical protein
MGNRSGGTIALAAGGHPSRFASVAMSNAAIKGGHIGYAPGWRAEIARVGIAGWSERLMGMRFVPGAVPPEALAWFAAVQAKSPAHVVIGLGELLIGTDLTAGLSTFKSPLLLMMPDRSPFVSLAQANALAELVPQTEIAVFPGARHGRPSRMRRRRPPRCSPPRSRRGRLFPPRARSATLVEMRPPSTLNDWPVMLRAPGRRKRDHVGDDRAVGAFQRNAVGVSPHLSRRPPPPCGRSRQSYSIEARAHDARAHGIDVDVVLSRLLRRQILVRLIRRPCSRHRWHWRCRQSPSRRSRRC